MKTPCSVPSRTLDLQTVIRARDGDLTRPALYGCLQTLQKIQVHLCPHRNMGFIPGNFSFAHDILFISMFLYCCIHSVLIQTFILIHIYLVVIWCQANHTKCLIYFDSKKQVLLYKRRIKLEKVTNVPNVTQWAITELNIGSKTIRCLRL